MTPIFKMSNFDKISCVKIFATVHFINNITNRNNLIK